MILIFKTSVRDLEDIEVLKNELNKVPTMVRWNFDLEDIDNVLRVESIQDVTTELVHVLNDKGFECEDLDDGVMLNMTCTED
ncbi:hypothetical protein ACOKFD_14750 [Flagellimonas sp. S174]|uniref:hypothetical protein n=1 Tax=Flagellimonas sp. S174 TaxID=3410790 RepID=UPI003BF550DA